MHFYAIPLGVSDEDKVELGSLRFDEAGTLYNYFNVDETAVRSTSVDGSGKSEILPQI
jgi:hypothetical protein